MSANAWLVIMDPGGIFGAWLDAERAHGAAKAIGGVVVALPVAADYRPDPVAGEAG